MGAAITKMSFINTIKYLYIKKNTLLNPAASSLVPKTGPTPGRAVTFFSPIGSETKSRCFLEVFDIFNAFDFFHNYINEINMKLI